LFQKSASSDAATTWKLVFLIQKQNNVLTGSKKIMISCLKNIVPYFRKNIDSRQPERSV
jgi:hypothetical protein